MLSVSVVTPSFNQARYVERTVRSVLDQAYPNLEYVVFDGASTDGTLDVLAPLASRLTLVSHADRGQADAVNQGIRATSGEVIGWLNSDDVYVGDALTTVSNYLQSAPDVDVVYGDANLIDADDTVVGRYYTEPWNAERLQDRCFLCQPAVFIRRRVVARFGLLDETLHYALDYEYWLRLAAGGAQFAYLPTLLAASRLHPETKTLSARLAVHRELNGMLRGRLGRVPDSWLLNNAHTLVELERANGRRRHTPYALAVVLRALQLSMRWNQRISPELVAMSARPIVLGARRRLRQSRSALTNRPAS